jgi:hypothetical protein
MDAPVEIMDKVVAGRTVRASIAAAEVGGKLIPVSGIRWAISKARPGPWPWIGESKDASRNCQFYIGFMFEHVYRRQRVPAGCSTCYKVKVVPRSLRQAVAVLDIGRALPYTWKCGLDAPAPFTSGIYGAYFYLHGLVAARVAYKRVREAVDAHSNLGPDVTVFIKRGCTEYEIHCGPSDGYTFTDESRETEAALLTFMEFTPDSLPKPERIKQTFAHWIRVAYSLGDETYLDFTRGRRLYPAVVKYAPEARTGEA